MSAEAGVRIEAWGQGDLPLLEGLLGDPAMTEYVGGPETPEKIAERQARYERPGSRQFKIIDEESGEGVGWVGCWEITSRDEQVYEMGWSVLPAFQGRGIARAATAQAIEKARAEQQLRACTPTRWSRTSLRMRSAERWASAWWRRSIFRARGAASCDAMTGSSTSSRTSNPSLPRS